MGEYIKKQWKTLVLVTIFGIGFNALMPYIAILQGGLIDSIIGNIEFYKLAIKVLLFICVVIAVQTMRYYKRYYVRKFANLTMREMRLDIYNSIMMRDIAVLSREGAGDLMVKAVSDVDICVEGLRKVITEIFDTGVLMLSYIIALSMFDIKITIISCIFVPIAMWIAEYLKTVIVKYSKEARKKTSEVAQITYNDIEQTILLRINGLEQKRSEEYYKDLETLEKLTVKASILEGSMQPIYNAIAMLGAGFVIYLNGKKVIDGNMTIGGFSSYMAMFIALSVKTGKAAKLFNSYQKAVVSWGRIEEYLHDRISIDKSDFKDDKPINLDVRDLSFSYPKNTKVENTCTQSECIISNISFSAKSGDIIGVCGAVASGKTTLGLAISGLYGYSGSVKLTGHEIKDMSEYQRSRRIAIQSHSPELLTDSIYNNITLGDGGDITEILRCVCFDEDLKTMPDGINTIVGSGGVRLSGGQQARIALARALYHRPNLIILDDPLSAVDMKTENQILDNIKKDFGDSIIILISHRLSVFPYLSKIIVLDSSKRAEYGVHDELLKKSDNYLSLYSTRVGLGGETKEDKKHDNKNTSSGGDLDEK